MEDEKTVNGQLSARTKSGLVLNRRDRDLIEKGHTLRQWITDWYVPKQRYVELRQLDRAHPLSGVHREAWTALGLSAETANMLREATKHYADNAGRTIKREQYRQDFISPALDPNFLRKFSPLLCSKLWLNMRIQHEEFGINFANDFIQIFCICHLYNGLRQAGRLKDLHWTALEEVIEIHIQTMFAGKLPTQADAVYLRLLYAAGANGPALVNAKKKLAAGIPFDPAQVFVESNKNKKSWNMDPSPMTKILRDHFDGKDQNYLATLHKIDVEMQKQSKEKYPKSFINDLGTIPFLQRLEKELPALDRRLQIDYLGLTCTCNDLL